MEATAVNVLLEYRGVLGAGVNVDSLTITRIILWILCITGIYILKTVFLLSALLMVCNSLFGVHRIVKQCFVAPSHGRFVVVCL